jgi:hypothetical protein
MLCLYHRPNQSIFVSNGRLKFKHLFEKKARPTHGKYVTFFSILGFWGVKGRLVGPENRSLLRNLPIAAALKAVSPPRRLGTEPLSSQTVGKERALPAWGSFRVSNYRSKLERLFESRQDGGLENREL